MIELTNYVAGVMAGRIESTDQAAGRIESTNQVAGVSDRINQSGDW